MPIVFRCISYSPTKAIQLPQFQRILLAAIFLSLVVAISSSCPPTEVPLHCPRSVPANAEIHKATMWEAVSSPAEEPTSQTPGGRSLLAPRLSCGGGRRRRERRQLASGHHGRVNGPTECGSQEVGLPTRTLRPESRGGVVTRETPGTGCRQAKQHTTASS